jgi:hypothetical protein
MKIDGAMAVPSPATPDPAFWGHRRCRPVMTENWEGAPME